MSTILWSRDCQRFGTSQCQVLIPFYRIVIIMISIIIMTITSINIIKIIEIKIIEIKIIEIIKPSWSQLHWCSLTESHRSRDSADNNLDNSRHSLSCEKYISILAYWKIYYSLPSSSESESSKEKALDRST